MTPEEEHQLESWMRNMHANSPKDYAKIDRIDAKVRENTKELIADLIDRYDYSQEEIDEIVVDAMQRKLGV